MNMTPVDMALLIMNGLKILLIIPFIGIVAAIIKYRKNTKKMMLNILYYVLITLLVIAVIFLACFVINDALEEIVNLVSEMAS